jgi:hypothetical protein
LPEAWSALSQEPDIEDKQQASEIAFIKSCTESNFVAKVSVSVDFSSRFLCKLALGIGHNLLGNAFGVTTYAGELRKALREKDPQKRAVIEVRGSNYFAANRLNELAKLLGLSGTWVIALNAYDTAFILSVITPAKRFMSIIVSDDPSLWAGDKFDKYRYGAVFVVLPQRDMFLGPIDMQRYLARAVDGASIPELSAIEALRIDPSTLPPKRAMTKG